MIDIVTALSDPNLFGPWFAGPSWSTWRAVLKGAFCVEMDAEELKLFHTVAGERDPPKKRVRQLVVVAGRRAGKDSIASAICAYAAGFTDYHAEGLLRPGEAASVMCLAVDKQQASIIQKYTAGYFQRVPLLKPLVTRETSDGFELSTGATLEVLASNFRNIRGRSVACCVMDEVGFWRSELTATPDVEAYSALMPSLMTIPNSMLIAISTPYRRSGLLYSLWKGHFGKDDDDILVVHGTSRQFNPTLDQRQIDTALKRDPAAARSEWEASWRDDIAAFLSRELIESAVDVGVTVRPPVDGEAYFAFADPSGGIADSFTCGIAHRDGDGRAILDCLHEVAPPFDPAVATKDIAKTLKAYGCTKVTSDKYAALWPVSEFARNDITLEHSERDRSSIYADFLPLLTSGRARILDMPRLCGQLANLERKTQPSGRDQIGHPANAAAHDDLANSAAGALVLAAEESAYWARGMSWVSDGTEAVPDGPPAGVDPRLHLSSHPSFLGGWRWFGQ
jgi:hypothetical protein